MEEKNQNFNEKFRKRTKQFAIKICKLFNEPTKKESTRIIIRQLIRSGTSLAANFWAASRSRSSAEYYAKLCIVVEETDETLFWFELLEETGLSNIKEISELKLEAEELLKVFSTTKKKLKDNKNSPVH
ncbi:MAG: four helix bundle protein [Bacteroidetes bacterium]|nr:four helix bundle protein [Bacteroidota bacterium]